MMIENKTLLGKVKAFRELQHNELRHVSGGQFFEITDNNGVPDKRLYQCAPTGTDWTYADCD